MRLPSRRVLLCVFAALLLLVIALGLPWLSPERGVRRAWDKVASAFETNDRKMLAAYLADDYHDGFGLDREGALTLPAHVRGQFFVCAVRREQTEIVMDADKRFALTRALIRIDGQGTAGAQMIVQTSQAARVPTEFRWRRASWKPWDWRLVSVDNPELARSLARFQREASAAGL